MGIGKISKITSNRLSTLISAKFSLYLAMLLALSIWGFVINKRYKPNKPFGAIAPFLFMVFILEALSKVSILIWGTNAPAYHLMSLVQLAFIGYIYSQVFPNSKKPFIIAFVALTTIFNVYNSLFLSGFWNFPTNNLAAISFVALILAMSHFREMLLNPSEKPLGRETMFWVNVTHLIFFGLTFFLWPFLIGVFEYAPWAANSVFLINLSMYSALFFGLYQQRYQNK
jgi:hypothetical protein